MTASIWKPARVYAGTAAICVVVASLQACSAPSPDKMKSHMAHAVIALEKERDADSLAAAALLRSGDPAGRSDHSAASLISRAALAAPDRADLAWLQITICQETPGCDTQPFEARVRNLDPSNGAGWFGALARAAGAKDDEATNEALRAISQADRVDIYYTRLIGALTPKVAETGSMSTGEAVVVVIGVLAAQAIPAYLSVSNACKGARLAQANVLSLCQGVARAFENGDTLLMEMIGVAIAKRVWPMDSSEWKAAADARRLFDYQGKLLGEISGTDAAGTQRYLALCRQYKREQDVFRAELVRAGKNPDPPGP